MGNHYLKYWRWQTIQRRLDDENRWLTHASSKQYSRVNLGDVVWMVCIEPSAGALHLAGRLEIGWIGSRSAAQALLKRDDLPDYAIHVIARAMIEQQTPGEPFRLINLGFTALQLRFISPTGRDRLSLYETRIHPSQLQAMRHLTPASAVLLDSIWRMDARSPSLPRVVP